MKFGFREKLGLLFLLIVSFWAIIPLLEPGLPNTHDGQTHVMRLASFHQALNDGQWPPRWAGNLSYGFGSPVLSFAFPLLYLLGDLFSRFGFSFIDSIKIVLALGYIASGLAMFIFLVRVWSYPSAIVGAFFYLLMPYRFLDIYVRGDVGESLVFVFPPLILLSLWNSKKTTLVRIVSASVATGLMFLSHQIMAGMMAATLLVIFIYRRAWRLYLASLFLGLSLAAFNLVPLVFEKSLTNLDTLSSGNFLNQFPSFGSLLYSKWNWGPAAPGNPEISMAFQIGIAQWLALVLLIGVLWWSLRRKEKDGLPEKYLAILILGMITLTLFLMTQSSFFLWERVSLLQMILYPWRLTGVLVLLTSLAAALLIHLIKPPQLRWLLATLLVVVAIYGNRHHNQVVGRGSHPDSYYLTYPGSSDMWGEFLPRSVKPVEKAVNSKVETNQPGNLVSNLVVKSNLVSFNIDSKVATGLTINNFNYPGWQIIVDKVPVENLSHDFLSVNVPAGPHQITAKFQETVVRKIGNIISLLGIIIILGMVLVSSKRGMKPG